jgi:intraflagellar transport protein 46
MPDFDALMSELNPEMEEALKNTSFPGAEIDMHPSDYARIILTMLDIPVHKLANNKSLIESLHVLFTLFSEFRQNQHFKNQEANGNVNAGAPPDLA